MFIKEFVKKILYGNRYSSETYIKYLKGLGVKIGERTVIFSPRETFIDEQYPWMVEIGNDVQITRGVQDYMVHPGMLLLKIMFLLE